MRYVTDLTQDELTKSVVYSNKTGLFHHKVDKRGGRKAGQSAGYVNSQGYIELTIDGQHYKGHRLAWLYVFGCWPENQLDHINGVKTDNRICNLRESTIATNQQNIGPRGHNKSGYVGVSWHKQMHKWRANIVVNKKQFHLGLFESPELAYQAYLKAKARLHTFQNTPRIG